MRGFLPLLQEGWAGFVRNGGGCAAKLALPTLRNSGLLASEYEGHCEGLAFPFLWFLLCFCHSAVSQAGMFQLGRCCPPTPAQLVLPFSRAECSLCVVCL